MFDLVDKVAVVTGASSGIGKAIALALSREKCKVCAVGRSLVKLGSLIVHAPRASSHISLHAAEFENESEIRALILHVEERFDGVDILVHSAGLISMADTEHASIDIFDRLFRVNVRAPYLLTQGFLPALRRRSGQIVFINSSAGTAAKPCFGQYSATKHALKAVADILREEISPEVVRVLSVYPGRTATPMQEAVHAMENLPYRPETLMQPEDVAAAVIASLALPRTTEITDIHMRPVQKL